MKEKHFWKVEYSITLLVLFAVLLLICPMSVKSTLQADLIARWTDCYGKLSYMKDVMAKHEQENMLAQLKRTQDREEREKIITMIIKPYFRLTESRYLKHYRTRYMNGARIMKGEDYYFPELYTGDGNIIVGIKDIKTQTPKSAMFMMMFDVNGLLPPNRWGRDIFGIKVFDDRIEPLGKDLPLDIMREDCSLKGTGISCSNYYLIGGTFID